jgi:Uma2 family endonuclease
MADHPSVKLEQIMATPQAQLILPTRVHQWTVEEYYRVGDAGLFEGRHVELLEGEIIDMATMLSPHATSVTLTVEAVREAFGQGWVVRNQMPLRLSDISEPEPDIVVVAGKIRDFKDAHPTTAALVIEVSESTLSYDSKQKASLYAKAELQDYWIINLVQRQVEVHRRPIPDTTAPYGFSYGERVIYRERDEVSPLVLPNVLIAVADLLP